jgi:hypothetical protein
MTSLLPEMAKSRETCSSGYLKEAFLSVVTNAIDPGSHSIVFVLLTS